MAILIDWRDIVVLVSLGIALDQYRRQRNEKRASRAARLSMLRAFTAYAFSDMARLCADLGAWIRIGNWERTIDLANRLTIGLADTSGSWPELLSPFERDKCEAVINGIRSIQKSIPGQEQANVDEKRVNDMIRQCENATWWLVGIAGRLKYESQEESQL